MKIKQAKKDTIQPIKPFQTITEEVEYWDTHSILDDLNEGTAVGFHQANKTDTLTIRFSHEDLQHLREEAFQQGIGPSTLVARHSGFDELAGSTESYACPLRPPA